MSEPENVQSPLHKLQTDLTEDAFSYLRLRQLQPNPETDSIYSFESVSTSGRLLDRLDLDNDDYDNELLLKRHSSALIQTMGRLMDRLGLDNLDENPGAAEPSAKPIKTQSALGLDRLRSIHKQPARTVSQTSTHNHRFALKAGPYNAETYSGHSFDSLHGSVLSGHGLYASLQSLGDSSSSVLLQIHGSIKSKALLPQAAAIRESAELSPSFPSTEVFPAAPPPLRSVNSSSNLSTSSLQLDMCATPPRRPLRSASSMSLEAPSILSEYSSLFDPSIDVLLRNAMQVRSEGNHREASYQLQILSNAPYCSPRAMYLYGQALQIGQGVKLNEAQANKWFCRCILSMAQLESNGPDLVIYPNQATELANELFDALFLKVRTLAKPVDPYVLFEEYRKLPVAALAKYILINSGDKNIVGGLYFFLGSALVAGVGFGAKDEELGRLFLAQAGALGHGGAMTKLGELWCIKTKTRKKDFHMAAAWLRLGELFGRKDIGNSWIYKEKYLNRKK